MNMSCSVSGLEYKKHTVTIALKEGKFFVDMVGVLGDVCEISDENTLTENWQDKRNNDPTVIPTQTPTPEGPEEALIPDALTTPVPTVPPIVYPTPSPVTPTPQETAPSPVTPAPQETAPSPVQDTDNKWTAACNSCRIGNTGRHRADCADTGTTGSVFYLRQCNIPDHQCEEKDCCIRGSAEEKCQSLCDSGIRKGQTHRKGCCLPGDCD